MLTEFNVKKTFKNIERDRHDLPIDEELDVNITLVGEAIIVEAVKQLLLDNGYTLE
jgi:G:T-mismatch repair DNA endonuclease (very short patch repair protein)